MLLTSEINRIQLFGELGISDARLMQAARAAALNPQVDVFPKRDDKKFAQQSIS